MKIKLKHKVLECVREADCIVYKNMGKHSQFVIDFLEDVDSNIDESEKYEEINLHILLYRIGNILQIIVEGPDKSILEKLEEKLENILYEYKNGK